jgi:hypothetical protein
MKLSEFILLNEDEKKQAVLHQGILVSKRKEASAFMFLFQVRNYYVEACFNTESKHLEEYRVFDDTNLLQPYLESISLDNLLN